MLCLWHIFCERGLVNVDLWTVNVELWTCGLVNVDLWTCERGPLVLYCVITCGFEYIKAFIV